MSNETMDSNESKRGTEARERLLSAAASLYWEQGVAATTPRQVLQRSGVGQGSLYHHFPAKRDLAEAAINRTAGATLDAARSTLVGNGPPMERLREYLTRPRDAVAGCRVGRLTSDPTVMSDDGLHDPVRRYFVALIDLVADVLAEAGGDPEPARRLATTVVAVIQGGYVISRALNDPAPMQQAVAGVIEMLESTGR